MLRVSKLLGMKTHLGLLWLALAVLIPGLPARGDLVIGNLPGNDGGSLAGFEQSVGYSIGFTVGANPFTVDSARFRLNTATGNGGNAFLNIRTDQAGNPSNTSVLAFNAQAIAANVAATYTFTPTNSVTLAANTTYWLTITNDLSAPDGLVLLANSPSVNPTGTLATFFGLRSGLVNDQSTDIGGLFSVPSFELNGTASVPEPGSTAVLVALCALATLPRMWQRRIACDLRS